MVENQASAKNVHLYQYWRSFGLYRWLLKSLFPYGIFVVDVGLLDIVFVRDSRQVGNGYFLKRYTYMHIALVIDWVPET